MNLQLFLIFFVLTVINLCSANCIQNQFQKSALPNEMPENTTIEYSSGCGFVSSCYIIVISGNQLRFEEKISEPQAGNLMASSTWLAQIPVEEKAKLYRAFVDNSFDLIENEETLDITLDAVTEGVEIRAGTFHKDILYGKNHPLSRNNLSRYRAVADSIKELGEKYKTDKYLLPQTVDIKKDNPNFFEKLPANLLGNLEEKVGGEFRTLSFVIYEEYIHIMLQDPNALKKFYVCKFLNDKITEPRSVELDSLEKREWRQALFSLNEVRLNKIPELVAEALKRSDKLGRPEISHVLIEKSRLSFKSPKRIVHIWVSVRGKNGSGYLRADKNAKIIDYEEYPPRL